MWNEFRIKLWIWNRHFCFSFLFVSLSIFCVRFSNEKKNNQKAYGNTSERSWRWTLKAIHLRDVIFLCRSIKWGNTQSCVVVLFNFFVLNISRLLVILSAFCSIFLYMHCFLSIKLVLLLHYLRKKCTTYLIKCATQYTL